MSTNRPAAGGGREILVDARRFLKWIDGFDARHRIVAATESPRGLVVDGDDGARAACELPLWGGGPSEAADGDARAQIEHFAEAAARPYRVGVVFARKGAVAVGVFDGRRLLKSKVDTNYVQSRTAKGGWSQQRYARRRGNQAAYAAGKAVDIVSRLLLEDLDSLACVVTAGDKHAVGAILEDRRLERLQDKLSRPHIGDAGEPRLASLKALPERFGAVRILLTEPKAPD